jgi:hypothetical protein
MPESTLLTDPDLSVEDRYNTLKAARHTPQRVCTDCHTVLSPLLKQFATANAVVAEDWPPELTFPELQKLFMALAKEQAKQELAKDAMSECIDILTEQEKSWHTTTEGLSARYRRAHTGFADLAREEREYEDIDENQNDEAATFNTDNSPLVTRRQKLHMWTTKLQDFFMDACSPVSGVRVGTALLSDALEILEAEAEEVDAEDVEQYLYADSDADAMLAKLVPLADRIKALQARSLKRQGRTKSTSKNTGKSGAAPASNCEGGESGGKNGASNPSTHDEKYAEDAKFKRIAKQMEMRDFLVAKAAHGGSDADISAAAKSEAQELKAKAYATPQPQPQLEAKKGVASSSPAAAALAAAASLVAPSAATSSQA